uniref:Uncharacterized protein n=1 Tax=Cacopsylla melanoneura TaxID=428564 RepID=A0A8D9B9E0_9HEMI
MVPCFSILPTTQTICLPAGNEPPIAILPIFLVTLITFTRRGTCLTLKTLPCRFLPGGGLRCLRLGRGTLTMRRGVRVISLGQRPHRSFPRVFCRSIATNRWVSRGIVVSLVSVRY